MDHSAIFGCSDGPGAGSAGDRANAFKRRTLLTGLAGLVVLPAMPSIPALAVVPARYGRGYRGGYR